MQKVLSTYLFISRKLTPELIGQIRDGGFNALEVFCSRAHFDYASKQEVCALAALLEANQMKLNSLHAPTSKDSSPTRESGQPLSVCEVEKVRRIEAMDEFKRAIDVSEDLKFSRMVLHMGGSREEAIRGNGMRRSARWSTWCCTRTMQA
jgi:sugar phosphate isomerase/epimerase